MGTIWVSEERELLKENMVMVDIRYYTFTKNHRPLLQSEPECMQILKRKTFPRSGNPKMECRIGQKKTKQNYITDIWLQSHWSGKRWKPK